MSFEIVGIGLVLVPSNGASPHVGPSSLVARKSLGHDLSVLVSLAPVVSCCAWINGVLSTSEEVVELSTADIRWQG